MDGFIFIYITNPNKKEARKIAFHLIKKKLAACANIYEGVNSIYPWPPKSGKIADEQETILIIKTLEKNFEKVKREVEKIHSYVIPCIIKIPITPNIKYVKWLKSEVK